MATITVSGQAEFAAALKTAQAGDRLILADGDYGTLTMTADFAQPVTITSENPLGASFAKISLTGATNVQFDNLDMRAGFSATAGSAGISVTNSAINGTLYLRDAQGIVVEGNTIDGGQHALILNSVRDFQVRGNLIHTAQEDLMRVTGNSFGGLIENNSFRDTISEGTMHPDAIQMFSVNGITPHDIVIRGNHIWDDPATGRVSAQGIFLADAGPTGYRNILIEDNLISVGSPNSIFVGGGQENVMVRNNTLIPSATDGGAVIRLAAETGLDNSGTTVTGNVMKMLRDETGNSIIGDNLIYGRNADLAALFSGSGENREDFLPPSLATTRLVVAPQDSVPDGLDGDTVLTGQGGNDVLSGAADPDTLTGGAETGTILGGDGDDTIRHALGQGGGTIDGGAGTDTLQIVASPADTTLAATINASGRITAIDGNSLTRIESVVADLGSGTDTLDYLLPAGVTVKLTVNLATGTATGFSSIANIENVTGNIGNDRLTGNAAANSLQGGAGNDTLAGGDGDDTLSGGDGNDLLTGGAGVDAILGGAGNDTIYHAAGDGAGSIDGGAGADKLVISGTTAAETLTATWTGKAITGFTLNGGTNTVTGVETITVNLGTGAALNTLAYASGSAAVTVDLNAGTASGFAAIARIQNLVGGNGNDVLTGNGSNNSLKGGAGADVLSGGGGYDWLTGGAGADTMWGGTGSDRFVFNSIADLGLGAGKRDVIMDFGGGDRLDFSGIDTDAALAGDQAFAFLSAKGAAFTAAGQIRWKLVDTDRDGVSDATLVELNLDSGPGADHDILLMNTTNTMVSGYFIL